MQAVLQHPLLLPALFLAGAVVGSIVTWRIFRDATLERRHGLAACIDGALILPPTINAREFTSSLGMKALVVSRDQETLSVFSSLFGEVNIETEHCIFESVAVESLCSEKIDILVLDLNDLSGAGDILSRLKAMRQNEKTVVFAVIGSSQAQETAASARLPGCVIVRRPFIVSKIRDELRSIYGRILRNRQSYFRLSKELPVSVRTASGRLLQCTTINLSQNGMAVNTRSPMEVGESLNIIFAIPNSDISVSAQGVVIWDNKQGKAGIQFECTSPSVKARFIEWLHDHFFMQDPRGPAGSGY